MSFLALFAADAARLPLPTKFTALAIFLCESGCDNADPGGGANRVVMLETLPSAGETGVRFTRKSDEEGRRALAGSKLGGFPRWVQAAEVPSCKRCGPMRFALQLDAEDVAANFGDLGVGYVFVCEHDARFTWQSG